MEQQALVITRSEDLVKLNVLAKLCSMEFEEAKEVLERCLAGRTTVLGEDHKDTLMTVNNLGIVFKVWGITRGRWIITREI